MRDPHTIATPRPVVRGTVVRGTVVRDRRGRHRRARDPLALLGNAFHNEPTEAPPGTAPGSGGIRVPEPDFDRSTEDRRAYVASDGRLYRCDTGELFLPGGGNDAGRDDGRRQQVEDARERRRSRRGSPKLSGYPEFSAPGCPPHGSAPGTRAGVSADRSPGNAPPGDTSPGSSGSSEPGPSESSSGASPTAATWLTSPALLLGAGALLLVLAAR